MNATQRRMYFHYWSLVRQILRAQNVAPKDADAYRYATHAALGLPKSSDDLSDDDLHTVLEHFRRIVATEPAPTPKS